jgi:ribA/ribD-fused uncharacterized protein
MSYNNNWLIDKMKQGEKIRFLFFWGHQPSKDGSIGQSCFSQWWVAPFKVDGIVYKTAEHWMMAGKARLFNDENMLEQILEAITPADAKKKGRLIKGFDPLCWDTHKYGLVVTGNEYKFNQNQKLKEFLLKTNDSVLVEASPVDKIWGIGLAIDSPVIGDPLQWKGENLLGYALMEVRDKLK